eukprot:2239-Heterococcus_DN1.PRE.1
MAAMVDSQPLRNGVMENDVNVQFLNDHQYMHQVREHTVLHFSWCLLAFICVKRWNYKRAELGSASVTSIHSCAVMWLSCMLHWALLGAQQLETVHAFGAGALQQQRAAHCMASTV